MAASRKKKTSVKKKSVKTVTRKTKVKAKAKVKKPVRSYSVRNSGIHGKGIFATRAIKKGARIIEYKGQRITEEQADKRYEDDHSNHTFLFLLNNDMVIDATYGGNSARWINHCCQPNCEPEEEDDRVYVHAKRDIKPGEELSYDYQLVIGEKHTAAIKKFYACRCGARKCRGNFLAEK